MKFGYLEFITFGENTGLFGVPVRESFEQHKLEEARRADRTWYAAILIPATERADINGIVRKTTSSNFSHFKHRDTASSNIGYYLIDSLDCRLSKSGVPS